MVVTGGEIVVVPSGIQTVEYRRWWLVKRRLGYRLVELDHQYINDYSNYTCKYAVSFNMQCHALSLT